MAISKRSATIPSFVLALWFAGCSGTPSGSEAQTQQSAEGGGTVKMTAYVDMNNTDMLTFSDPDVALIEKQVRAMDWKNPQQRPFVHINRIDGDSGSFVKLQGTMGTPNTDGLFRALGMELDGSFYESPPLESVDEGLELLLLFHSDPQKLSTMAADWKMEVE